MPTVTLTNAKLGNAIRNTALVGGTVDIALGTAFGVAAIGYLPDSRSYKVTESGINGGAFDVTVDDDAPTTFTLLFPDGATTAAISVDGADSEQALEDLLAGGDAPTGGLITVQGVIKRPFSDAVWLGMRVDVSLTTMFAAEDGVYLPVTASFKITENGLNGTEGVSLYVQTGQASQWRFDFYDSFAEGATLRWSAAAQFDDSMSVVEIADVLDGLYAAWIDPAQIPDAPTSVTAVPTGASLDDAPIIWAGNKEEG